MYVSMYVCMYVHIMCVSEHNIVRARTCANVTINSNQARAGLCYHLWSVSGMLSCTPLSSVSGDCYYLWTLTLQFVHDGLIGDIPHHYLVCLRVDTRFGEI